MGYSEDFVSIGCSSGFWGDSLTAAHQLVRQDDHPLDYLVCDYLAEVTMCLLARGKKKPSASMGPGGYIAEFVKMLWIPLMKDITKKGIKVVTNAGGLNPVGLKEAIEKASEEAGLSVPVVAAVAGDDLLDCQDLEFQPFNVLGKDEDLWTENTKLQSCNAYIGAQPIKAALAAGAQIVVTGRVADSAIVLGPLMHEYGWELEDFDMLAAGWIKVGFPIAECFKDGTAIITKPDNTGGIVTRGTVAEQLLYEIGDPAAYYLPDVVVDVTHATLEEVGQNRVRCSGVKGHPPSPWYKVSATCYEGFQMTANLVLGGLEAAAKGEATAASIIAKTRSLLALRGLPDFVDTRVEVLGAEATYGPNANPLVVANQREVVVRISAQHESMIGLGILGKEIAPSALAMAPGIMGTAGGRPSPAPIMKLYSALIEKSRVEVVVYVGAENPFSVRPLLPEVAGYVPPQSYIAPAAPPPLEGPLLTCTLKYLCYGRSGDKGDSANIGLIARRPELYDVIRAVVTAERVKQYMGHLIKGDVLRYEMPGVQALNFMCTYALGGGGMSSIAIDKQGKAYAQMLLSMEVEVPSKLLKPSSNL